MASPQQLNLNKYLQFFFDRNLRYLCTFLLLTMARLEGRIDINLKELIEDHP
jgi:hypothetical protein